MTFTRAGSPYNIPDSTLRYYHRKTSLAIALSPRHAVPTEVMAAAVTASPAATHRRLLNDDFEQKLMQYITTCRELAQPLDIHDSTQSAALILCLQQHPTHSRKSGHTRIRTLVERL